MRLDPLVGPGTIDWRGIGAGDLDRRTVQHEALHLIGPHVAEEARALARLAQVDRVEVAAATVADDERRLEGRRADEPVVDEADGRVLGPDALPASLEPEHVRVQVQPRRRPDLEQAQRETGPSRYLKLPDDEGG